MKHRRWLHGVLARLLRLIKRRISPWSAWRRRSPLIYLSFYLELPFDAGLKEGQALRKIHLADGPLEEWSDLDLDDLLGMPSYEVQGTFPCTTFQFRQATVGGPGRNAWAAAAFPEVFRSSPADARESRTVVRAIRIVPHESGELSTEWIRGQFDIALDLLGDYLTVLGEAAEKLRIGPVTAIELPSEIHGMQADFRGGLPLEWRPFTLLLFSDAPANVGDLSEDVINRALELVPGPEEARPFLPSFQMSAAARRSLFAGRFRQAALESGTAIELLLYAAVHMVGHGEEWPPERFRNILGSSFKNLAMHHVAPQFGFSPDLDSASDALGRWWRDGYQLRNRVAHEGHQPTKQEVVASLASASILDHDLGLALASHPNASGRFPDHLVGA